MHDAYWLLFIHIKRRRCMMQICVDKDKMLLLKMIIHSKNFVSKEVNKISAS